MKERAEEKPEDLWSQFFYFVTGCMWNKSEEC